jgi:hypothetical protein
MSKPVAAAAATLLAGGLWTYDASGEEVLPPPADATPPSPPPGGTATTPAETAPAPALDVTPAPPPDLAAPPTRWGDRMLAGHTFLYPALHAGPFITTNFGVAHGVYEESIPAVPIPGSRTTDLSVIGVTSTANLGIKITDWLGIEAQGRALAVIGNSGQSIIYAGGQLNAGGFAAPIVRIARIDATGTQISARAQIGELAGESLEIPRLLVLARGAVTGAVQNTPDPTAAARAIGGALLNGGFPRVILAEADTFGLNASIEAAQALGEMFGLQGAVTVQRRVNGLTFRDPVAGDFRESATRWDMLVDFSAEWDAMSLHVPIAAMLEYELNARLTGSGNEELEEDDTTTHTFGAGIYYSGRPNLQVGLFAATIRNLRKVAGTTVAGGPGFSGTPNAQYLQMVIRYVW